MVQEHVIPREDVDHDGLFLRVLFQVEEDACVEEILRQTRDVDCSVFALRDDLERLERFGRDSRHKPLVTTQLGFARGFRPALI